MLLALTISSPSKSWSCLSSRLFLKLLVWIFLLDFHLLTFLFFTWRSKFGDFFFVFCIVLNKSLFILSSYHQTIVYSRFNNFLESNSQGFLRLVHFKEGNWNVEEGMFSIRRRNLNSIMEGIGNPWTWESDRLQFYTWNPF